MPHPFHLSNDQIKARVDRASAIRSMIRDMQWNPGWEFTAYHADALALIPSANFGHVFQEAAHLGIVVDNRLTHISWAIRHFVLARHHDATSLKARPSPAVGSAALKERDGFACVLTGAPDAEAVPILPLSWSRDAPAAAVTASVLRDLSLFGHEGGPDVVKHLSGLSQVGETHHSWNMISLDRRLAVLWQRCLFGLEWVGSTTAAAEGADLVTVLLRFHWLQRETARPSRPVNDEALGEIMSQVCSSDNSSSLLSLKQPDGDTIALPSGMQIQSGHTLSISMPVSEVTGFEAMIRLQWVLVCMGALSGAAKDADSNDGDGESYDQWVGTAARWLEDIPDLPERFDDGLGVREGGRVVVKRVGGLTLEGMSTVMSFD
ncbi:hypothetical protein B0T11DRAFT_96281 [Plectosphaerella cucumerina]|uniref:HNH nuclease domain-containing protein n=1 Tax=Plectosphaerella cucumerina TaxID=40658 RepID=A0A8K0X1V1_9PEZI|nr:hypothetical protein B0T11DRAFT_96281 [Plectosphaerella cucumerina]